MDFFVGLLTGVFAIIVSLAFFVQHVLRLKLDLSPPKSVEQNGTILSNGDITTKRNYNQNNADFGDISEARLRQMIQKIIAETMSMPPLTMNHAVSEVALDRPSKTSAKHTFKNGYRHRTEHYFEPKIYQDLLATAVLNKIVDTQGNNRIISESTPDLSQSNQSNDMDQNYNVENQSTSSGSSVEPRSDCSYNEMDRILNNQINKPAESPLDPGRESTMSDYLAGHMVPLPDLSNVPTESEEDDFVSITSSAKGEGTWEHNWLFKKKHSSLGGSGTTATILIPIPKEDVRAQIGDKATDEVSDLSELGSETDDSSSGLLSTKMDPLNDRLLNKHIIGGQNSKSVLDELIESSSVPINNLPSEQDETYTDTLNEHVVDAPPKNEAINDEINKIETMDSETERKPSTECETEDVDIPAEGCLGFSQVEIIDASERTPSVIEILAAVALAPMIAVPAADQPAALTSAELSTLHELTDLALTEIKTRAGEVTAHDLEVIPEEPNDITLQEEFLIDLKNLPPPPALDDMSTDYIIENLILKPPDEIVELVTYIPIVEPPPEIEQETVESEQTNAKAIALQAGTSSVGEASQLLDTTHSREQTVLHESIAIEENQSVDEIKSNLAQVVEGNSMSLGIEKPAITEEIPEMLEVQQKVINERWSSGDKNEGFQPETVIKTNAKVAKEDLTSSDIIATETSEAILAKVEAEHLLAEEKRDRSSGERISVLQPESLVGTEKEAAEKDLTLPDVNGPPTSETTPVTPDVKDTVAKDKQDRFSEETKSDFQPEFVVKDETEVTETDLASPNVNELASNEAIPLAENTVAQHKQDRSSDKTDSQLESVAKTVIEVTEKDLTSSNIKETATSEAIPATLEVEDTVAHKTQDRSSDETKSNLQAESVVKTETEAGEKDLTSSDINEPATSKGTPPALDAEDMVGQETQDGSSDETISDIQPESVVKTETEVSDKDLTSSDINEPESSEPNPVTLEVEDVVAQQKQDRSSDETKSDIRPDSIAKTETEVAQKDLTSSVINEPASCEATPPTLDAEDTVAQEAQDQASDKTKSNIEAESVVKAETEVSDKDLNSSNINEPESTVTIPTTLEVEDAVVRQKQDRPSDGMKSDIDSIVKTETEVVQKDLTSSDINKPPTSEATPPTVAVEAAAAQEKQDRSSDETKSDIQPESIVKTETEVNDKDMNSTDINEQATNETIEATPEVEGTILKETQDRSSDEKRSDLQPESVAKTETEVSDKDLNSSDINEPESSELIPVTLEVEDVVAQQKQDRFSDGMKSDIQSDSIAKTETEVVQKDLTSSDISEPATSEATPPTVDVEAAAAQEKQGRSSDEANLQPEFVTKTETEVAEKDLTSSDVNELATSEATEATSDAEGTVAQETQDRSSDETISDIQPESVLKTETEVSDKDLTSSDINEPESSEPIPVTLEVEDMIAQQKQDRSSDEMKSDIQSDSIAKTETEIAQKDLTSSDISEPATSEATPPTVDVEAAAAQEKQDRSSDETKLQPEFVTKTETEVAEKDLTSSDVNELPTSEATPATLDVGDTAAQETQDQSSDERKPDLKPAVIARAKVISSDVNNSVTSETTPATVEVKSTVEHEEHVESSDETRSDLRLESTQQTEQKIGDEYITSMGLSGQDKLLESISDISVQALELIREEPKLDESNIASDLESSEIPILEPPAGFNEECETNIAVEEKETNESNVEKIIKENEEKASSEKLLFNMEEKVKSSETIHSTINQLISTENELTFTEKKEAFENEQSRAKINLNLHEELFSVAEQDENLSIKKSRHPSLGVIECQPTIIETFAISFEESTDNAFTDATTDDNLSRETSSCSFVATQRAKGNEDLEESAALKAQEHSTALYTQHTPQEVLEKSKALIGKPEEESKSSEKEAMVLLGPLPHEGSKVGEEAINAQNPSTENQQLNADAQAKETPQVTVEEQSHEERNVNIEMNANSPSPSQDEVIPPPVAFESEYILTNQSCETSAENAVKTVNLLAENSAIKNESIPDNIESSQASITKFETNPENLKVIEEKAEESSQFPQEKTIVEEQAGKLDSTAVSTEIVVPIVDSTMPDTSQKAATTSTIKSNEIIPSADINSTKEGHETRQPSEILPCVGADIQKNVLSDSPNISVVVPAREATTIASHVTTPSTEINSASENRETSQPAETSPSAEAVLHKTVLTDTPDTSVIATQDPDTNSACNETNRSNEVTSANEGQKIIQPSGIEKIGNDENISIALDPEIIQSCASLPGLVALNGTAITEDNVTEPKENVLISICNEKIKDSANSGEEEFVRSTEPLSTSIKIAIQEEILTQQGEKTDENSANISSIESSEATTLTSVINVAGKQTECKNDPIESEIPTVCCQSSTEPASIVKDEKTPIPAKEEIDSTKHLPKTSSEETVVSSSELSNSSATSVNVEESVVSETIVNAFATSNLRALDLEKSSVEQLSTKKEPQTSLEHASMDAIEIGSANLSKEQAPEIPIQEQHTLMKSEISTMALIDSAEREYLKWHNAVDMPNNPYAPEALKKRINGSQERCMDLPNISPGKEANPLEHITKEKLNDETDNKREIEYKRYSRDYYINNVSKSNESPSKSGSAEQYTEGCTTLKATNNSPPPQSNDHQEVLYKAVPAQVTVADDIGSSIENISQKSPKSANTSTSDDTDTVRIYDFKKQETIKVRSEVTPQRSEEEKDKENAMPTADRAKQLNFNRSESVGRGSTPSAFKFLQPKRRLIDPSHVMSLDEDERPLVSPMVDKPVIEKEVAEALPSVKALAKAFLLSSSASQTSQTEKPDTKKAKISPPLVQKKSIGPGKLSSRQEADTNEDATITSDLSSLDTDPSIVEITKDQECEAINNSTATTTTIPAPSAIKSCPSNTNTVPVREGVLKNNIAFFENLKFK
ncbi:myosin-7a binding protein isoform 1-T6 [Glossina fuscipes fuscipes]